MTTPDGWPQGRAVWDVKAGTQISSSFLLLWDPSPWHGAAHVQVVLTALLTQPKNALTAVPRGLSPAWLSVLSGWQY